MGAATVSREIARLDAISRTRALEPGETIQLQKLISTERRYAYMRTANARARQPQEKGGETSPADDRLPKRRGRRAAASPASSSPATMETQP